jgi:hypothetical protein
VSTFTLSSEPLEPKPLTIEDCILAAAELVARDGQQLNHFYMPMPQYNRLRVAICPAKAGLCARDRRIYERGKRGRRNRMNDSTVEMFLRRYVDTEHWES